MRKKYLILSFLLMGVIGISTFGNVFAFPGQWEVTTETIPYDDILEIINADYLDLDDDGYEDDIVTEFIFRVPTGNLATMQCDLYMTLVLPSQALFYTSCRFIETFTEISILMEWYNVASECGDYQFHVQIDFFGIDEMGYYISGSVYEYIIFDPPTEGPVGGLPFGVIYIGR